MSWHTLYIDKGVEKGILEDIERKAPRYSVMCFEFNVEGEHIPRCFFLPGDFDKLLPFLFDMSHAHTIDHAFRIKAGGGSSSEPIRSYSFAVVPSKDGTTNITPEFIDVITRFEK